MNPLPVPDGPSHPATDLHAMIPATLLSQAGDNLVSLLFAGGGLLCIPLFVASEDGFSKWGAGGAIAVCAAVATAFFKSRKDVIKAHSEAKVAAADTLARAAKETTDGMLRAHEAERESYQLQIKGYQQQVADQRRELREAKDRADSNEKMMIVERIARHDAEGPRQAAISYCELLREIMLREIMRQNNIPVPSMPESIERGSRIQEHDAELKEIIKQRVDGRRATSGSTTSTPPDA